MATTNLNYLDRALNQMERGPQNPDARKGSPRATAAATIVAKGIY